MTNNEPPDININNFYTFSAALGPVSSPSASAELLEHQLKSKDWVIVCNGLLQFRRILLHDVEVVEGNLENLVPLLVKCLSSLRSAVVRATLFCIQDLTTVLKCDLSYFINSESSSIFYALLEKSSCDKKFLTAQAHSILETLINYVPIEVIIEAILPLVTHNRPQFRTQVAFTISHTLKRAGNIEVFHLFSLKLV
jgi:hypothetical protein